MSLVFSRDLNNFIHTLSHARRAPKLKLDSLVRPVTFAASLFYSYMPMFGSFPYSRRGAWVFGDHEHENDMKLRASLQSEELCPAQV